MKIKLKIPNLNNVKDLSPIFVVTLIFRGILFIAGFFCIIISFLSWNFEMLLMGIRSFILCSILYIILFVRYER